MFNIRIYSPIIFTFIAVIAVIALISTPSFALQTDRAKTDKEQRYKNNKFINREENKKIEELERQINSASKKENEETEADEEEREHDPCEAYEISYEAYIVCKNKIIKRQHKINLRNKAKIK